MKTRLVIIIMLAATCIARADVADLATWQEVPAAAAPAYVADLLPKGARLVDARSGEMLRLSGATRPSVGRLWRGGETLAYVDESDLLVTGKGTWTYVVPLGAHLSVAVAGDVRIEEAVTRDPGYAWEVYEDALVRWGEASGRDDPPQPPGGAARGAWIEARAASILLAEAGALEQGGRSLRVALALDGVARSRPLMGPYYRDVGLRVERGPLYVRVSAAAQPGKPAAARVLLDGATVAGGALAVGPSIGETAAPSSWVVRVPRGRHALRVTSTGAPTIRVEGFRKRQHVADGISGDEDIDGRAEALNRAHPLVAADAQRLLHKARGRAAFAQLVRDASPAVRAFAGWRLGELEPDPATAARAFAAAEAAVAALPPGTRGPVGAAIALARLRRAERDGAWADASAVAAARPELWTLGAAAGGLAGDPARLAAAVASAPLAAIVALRRAFYDQTIWDGAPLSGPSLLVLTRDPEGQCVNEAGDAYEQLDATERVVTVPADPLGTPRFLRTRIAAFAPDGPALDAEMIVDGVPLPVPVVTAAEELRVALAPGAHRVSARGRATLYLEIPGGEQLLGARACERHRRRRYAEIGAEAVTLPVRAPAGSLLGVELRVLDPRPGAILAATLRIDGRERALRLRADTSQPGGAARPVSPAAVVDLVARDPGTLALRRDDRAEATLLARPLLRIARPSPEALALQRAGELVARLLRGAPALEPGAPVEESLRRLSTQIAATRDPGALARLLLVRARLLAGLGRTSYAAEDLRRADALAPDAGYAVILEAASRYVEAQDEMPGYPLEATAGLLHRLRDDPRAAKLAARAHGGAATAGQTEMASLRAAGGDPDDATLAITARFDDRNGDAGGAATAYAALARRHPDDGPLSVAEAARRLDALAAESAAKPPASAATRAYVAALRGDGSPGARDALARAADVTRWRAVTHAERAAGSLRATFPAEADARMSDVRNALLAPDLPVDGALWIEAGEVARATLDVPRPTRVRVETRCRELRPAAALQRVLPAACRLEIRVDGRAGEPGLVPAGKHSVEVVHASGGLDALAAVRFVTDTGMLGARLEETRFLADASEPVRLAVLGPTVLRIAAAGAPIAVGSDEATLAEVGAGKSDVILPEERPYQLELRPRGGRAAVAAWVREDRTAPPAPPAEEIALLGEPAALPTAGAPPVVPPTALRFVQDPGEVGTISVAEELRDGHIGDRDTTTARGDRYAETRLTYRRRAGGDAFVRADLFGRLRPEGSPSGGIGAHALFAPGDLRLSGGVLAVMQNSDTGALATGWLDAAAALRLALGGDLFFTPSLGYIMRHGEEENPGGDALDPDVWSQFDVERPHQFWGQARLDWEPFLDLHARARLRAVTLGLEGVDRAGALVGVSGAIGRLAWGTSLELERRFAIGSRLYPITQPIFRAGASFALWRHGRDRFSLGLGASLRPDERVEAWLGLSYDWTFGRGMRDFAPDEQEYAAQIGPYAEGH